MKPKSLTSAIERAQQATAALPTPDDRARAKEDAMRCRACDGMATQHRDAAKRPTGNLECLHCGFITRNGVVVGHRDIKPASEVVS